jgi:hypothetical protein
MASSQFGTAKYDDPEFPGMSDDHDHDDATGRVTAPMQDFSMRQVGAGFAVLLVGLAVAYVLPTLA